MKKIKEFFKWCFTLDKDGDVVGSYTKLIFISIIIALIGGIIAAFFAYIL